jgi:dolichyl-phosphate beta-glucosyltransferase
VAGDVSDTSAPFLSVAITAYNEERRILPTLHRIQSYLESKGYSYEIVVNDDGSRDSTSEVVRGFPCPHVRLIAAPTNQGKGAGIRSAVLRCRGDYILFTDADLSTPIEEVEKLLAALEGPCDVAIGSRVQPDGYDMRSSQPCYRRLVGRFYHLVAWLLVIRDVKDTQAGFKCFKRDAAHRLFGLSKLNSIIFDVEVLYLAQKLGYRVCEVPVSWTNAAGSRMRVTPKHALTVISDLIRIRLMHTSRALARRERKIEA